MKNAVGREIPEEILKITGKEVFHGVHYYCLLYTSTGRTAAVSGAADDSAYIFGKYI